jgi:hypothetical protein
MSKAKNLKSTGIGEHRAIPGEETVQTTGPPDEITPGL